LNHYTLQVLLDTRYNESHSSWFPLDSALLSEEHANDHLLGWPQTDKFAHRK
jgi:hypothetical protein